MSICGYDPGDRNNWYQSPQMGLFPVSPAVYGCGISGGCYSTHSYYPHGSPSYPPPPPQYLSQPSYPPPPSQFPSQPSYPLPPPSPTIINGYVFPHQFPHLSANHTQLSIATPSPHNYLCSQNQRYSSTGLLTTTPQSPPTPIHPHPSEIYHHYPPTQPYFILTNQFVPPPSPHEQPRPISDLKQVEPVPQLRPIPMEPDRVRDCEVPSVDSGYSSFTPELTVKLKGTEKPPSPPRGSGKLQVHNNITDAKLCEMQESLKSSMDTFISEFREELRLLRGSWQSPASQVDNPLKFVSPPPSSTPELIPAATEALSSLIPADNGIIHKTPVDSDLNLSHTDVILGFNDNTSMDNVVGFVCGAKLNGIDEKLDTGKGESSDKKAEVNIGNCRGFNELESVIVKQVDQGLSLCGKYHALYMFDKVLLSDGLCNAGRTIVAPMSIRDKGGGLATHREIVDASLTSTALLSSSTPVPIEADREERNVVMTNYRESSKMDSLEQGTEPSSDSLVGYAELLLPGCVSKVARLLETVLQNGDICLIILEKKRIEAVLQLFTFPLMPLSVTISPSIPIAFKNFTPQHSASLAWVVCYTDYQSRSHLLQWFTLCFELCNCETTKEPPLSCRLIQTSVSRVFTTIISGPQYFRADFYEVLCDLYKLYVVIHNPFNDNVVNLLPDDTFGIMGSVASFVVDMYAHFGASLILEMEKQCEKECSKVYMLDSTQGHLILALETVHFRAACPWALWFHCLALPADKNGFLTVFSSQFCDLILLKANPYQPTTWGQIVSLRFDTAMIYLLIPNVKLIFIIGGMTHNNLNHAALHTAFWSPQMCKDIDQLQTHSTIIITLVVGVISENINDQTKAISQPRSFSIDEVIDSLQINLEFSSSRYSSDPLLSIGYGVVLMPNMHKFSQYMVGHVHKDEYFLASSSSNFYSSVHGIHALVRKLFPLSPMVAIRPLLVNIIREDAPCISGIMLVISMIELVSLKSKKQGFEIMYGDVSDGNYCSHMSSSLYFLDFMITWFIEFGFVAIVSVDLALVPFSVPMQSNEAPLLILIFRIIHSQEIEFVNSSHLLQGPNREALRISATSHVGVHLCALMHNCVFKYYICLLKQRMEFPWNYMPYNKLTIFLNWITETWSGFKEVANIDTTLHPTVGVFYAADNSSTGTDSEKMSERDLLGDIIKTLLYVISEIIHVAPDNLDSFSAYLPPSRYNRDTSITAELSNENCNDSQEICGIARLVLGLASSVGAMYRAGADDAIFNINNVMVSWVLHMNRLVQGSFHHLIQWGITLEFVSTISIYGCFFYNNLGAAFDNTMALQLVNIVDYALGTSLNAFDRYWDKMFLLLAISAVLEPQMPKITFGDLDNEAGTSFGRHFRLEVKPVL